MKSYYAYTRVSTIKQGELGVSLNEQKDAIRRYAAARNLNITEWFEETVTAAKQGRQLFTRMIVALEKGRADGVILHKVDRGARNLWDWARLQGLLDRNVEVHFVHESLDLNSRGGRLTANLQAVIATDYIWNLREEVRKGIDGRLKQGLYPLRAPIGYLDSGKGKPKTIDPIKGPLVRRAFELYASGRFNFDGLRAELYSLGLRTKGGNRLSRNGLTTMLNNPFYVGLIRMRSRREVYQGIHQPLISTMLFDQVQNVLHGRDNGKAFRHDFTFRRLFKCVHCGYSLVGETHKGHVYYRCHTKGCATAIRQDAIEMHLAVHLSVLSFDDSEKEYLRAEIAGFKEAWSKGNGDQVQAARLQLQSLDDRLQRLTDALLDQAIDRESYAERRSRLLLERAAQREKYEALVSGKRSPADDCEKFLERAFSLQLTYENGFPHEKRDLLKLATSNLSVDRKNVVVELRMPFRLVAMYRKYPLGELNRYAVRTDMKKLAGALWGYFVEEAERRYPVLKELREAGAGPNVTKAANDDVDGTNPDLLVA